MLKIRLHDTCSLTYHLWIVTVNVRRAQLARRQSRDTYTHLEHGLPFIFQTTASLDLTLSLISTVATAMTTENGNIAGLRAQILGKHLH